jgi:hypothetical protein
MKILKLLQNVKTRWNSEFYMLRRVHENKNPLILVIINIFNSTPDIQLKQPHNFNILPLFSRYFQHFCLFTFSLFKFNSILPLSTSILIFNNRNKIIHPSFNNKKIKSLSKRKSSLLIVLTEQTRIKQNRKFPQLQFKDFLLFYFNSSLFSNFLIFSLILIISLATPTPSFHKKFVVYHSRVVEISLNKVSH